METQNTATMEIRLPTATDSATTFTPHGQASYRAAMLAVAREQLRAAVQAARVARTLAAYQR